MEKRSHIHPEDEGNIPTCHEWNQDWSIRLARREEKKGPKQSQKIPLLEPALCNGSNERGNSGVIKSAAAHHSTGHTAQREGQGYQGRQGSGL
ncbi:hypothetical protein PoMZ_12312 [Pyricularia oryzae]|uniref:Uncharacterized protein n=1 Tax=Pyricularia oryzae TaxID=318829 RepID=A0A4P7NSC6_PYROR|nr:hypothetical protein PoMZ_12312 [Pyricularia oryzae]